jgi:hypothetical protein
VSRLILLYILQLIFLLLVAVYLYLTWINLQLTRRKDRVVLLSSDRKKMGSQLLVLLERFAGDPAQMHFIELGAGFAYIAELVAKRWPASTVEAVEVVSPYAWLGKLRLLLSRAHQVTMKVGDVLTTKDYPTGSVLYCYLLTDLLDQMYQSGSLKGCLVITLTFPITGIEPAAILPVAGWQKCLYVYDFRATPSVLAS